MELSADAIWLATAAVDMRTGVDGLSLHVQQALGRAPCDGTVYVFANRRRTRLKLVCWDGTGVWICLRRLHRGQFVWPRGMGSVLTSLHGLSSIDRTPWSAAMRYFQPRGGARGQGFEPRERHRPSPGPKACHVLTYFAAGPVTLPVEPALFPVYPVSI